MSNSHAIKTLLKRIVANGATGILPVIAAKVIAVNKDNATICAMPIDTSQPEILDIRLRADVSNLDGLVVFPAIDSHVLLAPIDNNNTVYFVVGTTEITETIINVLDTSISIVGNQISINSSNIILNNGQIGGLVKLPELVEALNNINQFLSIFRQAIKVAVPVAGDGGAAIKSAVVVAINNLPLANTANLGNEKIIQ